ncbi:hypothetical protein BSM4216_2817 [Bacillus smithii]|nr:hypothetical protein BSM4216_2817 [Bacillus smithii]
MENLKYYIRIIQYIYPIYNQRKKIEPPSKIERGSTFLSKKD